MQNLKSSIVRASWSFLSSEVPTVSESLVLTVSLLLHSNNTPSTIHFFTLSHSCFCTSSLNGSSSVEMSSNNKKSYKSGAKFLWALLTIYNCYFTFNLEMLLMPRQ